MCSRTFRWLPLVAGLFFLVEGLDCTGVLGALSNLLHNSAEKSATQPHLVPELSWRSPAT
jgi:Na+/H+ antiporter NhaD/arsenite permease-like protein